MTDSAHDRSGQCGRIFISGGEISGERQAAHLAREILRQNPGVELYGCGGDWMREAGVDVQLETAQLGYVGVAEWAEYRRPIREATRALRRLLKDRRPDLAVLVDGEHFNRFLIPHLQREGIPFIYYFVPLVWFWRRWRTRGIARRARLVIPAFSQEAEIFRRAGGRVEWLGHPLLDLIQPEPEPEASQRFTELGLDPAQPTIALMPGSRWQEVENFAPRLLAAASRLKEQRPNLQFILPLAAPYLRPALEREIAGAGLTAHVKFITEDVYTCLSRCEVVLLASGTATLETALLGVPMVVFYSVKPLTFFIARRLVTTPYISMPNILLNEEVVPELIQHNFTVERLVAEAARILDDPAHAQAVRQKLAAIPARLGKPGVLARAARLVLQEAGCSPVPTPVATLCPAPAT